MDKIKFRLEEGTSEFDGDKVSDLQNLQRDIEDILDYTLSNSQDPADYIEALYNYFKAREFVVNSVIDSMLEGKSEEDSDRPSLSVFTNKIALMHLHARQSFQKMKEANAKIIEKTVNVKAPKPTGYVVYDTVEEQKKALEEIRNKDEMKDIFPDIARA